MNEQSLFTEFWTKESTTTSKVLARIPEQSRPIQAVSARPGQLLFDAIQRRAGIRYEDLV